jgi:hypothetical protein
MFIRTLPLLFIALVAPLVSSPIYDAARSSRITLLRLPDGGLQPQTAVDDRGVVHILYFKGDPAHGDLLYARLNPDGTFSKPLRVNTRPGSAVATGTMRGGHLAIGRHGRVHVAWHGSDQASPKAPGEATPVMYTRLNAAEIAFEPERNVVQRQLVGLDGGTVAADRDGNVYVAWHAFEPGRRGEADRRVWVTRSTDEGNTFGEEVAASPSTTGACGCCGIAALASHEGALYVLFRAATENVHRDAYLLTSHDYSLSFTAEKLQDWNIGACPMSSFSFADTSTGVLAAWETAGQVEWTRIDPRSGRRSANFAPAGSTATRKHPAITANDRNEVLLAWAEGTAWSRGGDVAWQLFDRDGNIVSESGRAPGLRPWSLPGIAARPDGGFVIVY